MASARVSVSAGRSLQTTCKKKVYSKRNGAFQMGQRCPGAFNFLQGSGTVGWTNLWWQQVLGEGSSKRGARILGYSLTENRELREPLDNASGHVRGFWGLPHAGAGLGDPCGSLSSQDVLEQPVSVAAAVSEGGTAGRAQQPGGSRCHPGRGTAWLWGGARRAAGSVAPVLAPRGQSRTREVAGAGDSGRAVPGAGGFAGKAGGDFWVPTCWWSPGPGQNGK